MTPSSARVCLVAFSSHSDSPLLGQQISPKPPTARGGYERARYSLQRRWQWCPKSIPRHHGFANCNASPVQPSGGEDQHTSSAASAAQLLSIRRMPLLVLVHIHGIPTMAPTLTPSLSVYLSFLSLSSSRLCVPSASQFSVRI